MSDESLLRNGVPPVERPPLGPDFAARELAILRVIDRLRDRHPERRLTGTPCEGELP